MTLQTYCSICLPLEKYGTYCPPSVTIHTIFDNKTMKNVFFYSNKVFDNSMFLILGDIYI